MPKHEIQKIVYVCRECGAEMKRKQTEPEPHACNYCHCPNFTFYIK